GLINDDQLAQALAEQMSLRAVALGDLQIDPKVIELVTEPMAQMYRIVPVEFDGSTLTVAMCDPQNLAVQDELRTFLGHNIRVVVATEPAVKAALERYYGETTESVESIVSELESDSKLAAAVALAEGNSVDLTSVEALADSAPVRKLLNMVLLLAIKDHASDLHFEPFEDEFRIRIKADGVLYEMVPPPRHLAFAITTRIKVMANLDIAERRLPQDGRIELTVGGRSVDLRVSTLPTMYGESTVMRILDRSNVSLSLDNLGLVSSVREQLRRFVDLPHGIVLVTGPTGSGKTTTLYAMLNEANKEDTKVITVEDPVEYDLEGIIQVPVNEEIGVSYASVLRTILRQDPDVILVGEIRDRETAQTAIEASLTGHLVFSTLHTNDAASAVTRLVDIGIEPFLLTATVQGILAQRLVRRVCRDCKTFYEPADDVLRRLGLVAEQVVGKKFAYGKGCATCNFTGYRGRMAITEILDIDDRMRELILQGASTAALQAAAVENGLISLRENGLNAIFDGHTSAEEVLRETIAL
ncbi:MAG: type II/IV secretion system protein, partial [Planctomycetes bacterium]|nr:type II/IV secretion system protein [Planctomycetota bacterium]